MKNIAYAIAILLGTIVISVACDPIDEDYLNCPTCHDDDNGNNGNNGNGNTGTTDTTVVNGNDTIFIYSTKVNLNIDTITTVNIETKTFETNDPNAVATRDTTRSEVIDEDIVETEERKWVEPDSLFVTTIQDIYRTYYITLDVVINEPVLVDPPVDGADETVYLEMSIFTHLYGQIETNGTRYLNFYGNQRGAHVKKTDFTDVIYKSSLLSREAAIADAEKHNFSGVAENLYYDHVQSIWIWVFNKETKSFMIEAKNGISWNSTPSSKDRFFEPEFEIKEGGKELWITINEKIICFVARNFEVN